MSPNTAATLSLRTRRLKASESLHPALTDRAAIPLRAANKLQMLGKIPYSDPQAPWVCLSLTVANSKHQFDDHN